VNKKLIWIVLWLWCPLPFSGQNHNQKYQNWLDSAAYIILPQEKDVFSKLTNDRDRDIFIESFWKQRDPTPGTPENEYKDEHMRRWHYANEHFKRGAGRPGWMTDQGRTYIILGQPVNVERFEGTLGIVPCQAWTYHGDPQKELPSLFVLLFYQRGGAGEYKLYNPVTDGPASLLQDKRNQDLADYAALYERIKELAPTLADISISIVPGEHNPDYSPSTRNSLIMADIYASPKKAVNPSYATRFLDYRGYVSTEYLTNYVECESDVSLIRDPLLGVDFLHFSIVPQRISIDSYEPRDQFYCDFKLDVSLRVGEAIIFQYARDFPFYFNRQDSDRVRANGVSIEDSFPVVEGNYRLIALLRNSVGKEFSILEKDISVPEDGRTPKIGGPYLGYKTEDYQPGIHMPYKILDKKLLVDPKNVLSSADNLAYSFTITNVGDELWKDGTVRILIKGLREKAPFEKSVVLRLASSAHNKIFSYEDSFPAKDFPPDYYQIRLTLLDKNGNLVDEKTGNFAISPERAVGHPIATAKALPAPGRFLYFYMRARQYDQLNQNEKAEEEYRKAYALNPAYKERLAEYATFLLKTRQFDRVLDMVENFRDVDKLKFEYWFLRGKAQMGKGEYGEAIRSLLEGNRIYNSETRLLNALGLCFYNTALLPKALDVLRASLRLNPEQPEIKKLLEEIEKVKSKK
jgi:GWxTD domain-containing protein